MPKTLSYIFACISAIGGILGIVDGLKTADEVNLSLIALSLLLVIISLFFLCELYAHARKLLALRTTLEKLSYPSYHISVATASHLAEISRMQRDYYDADAVPENLYREWYRSNPEGFFVIERSDVSSNEKELVGHITIMSLKKQRLSLYLEGEILETEIRGNDIIPPDRNSEISHIYIESAIVSRKHRNRAIPEMIKNLPAILEHFCPGANVGMVYALAATRDGMRILKNNGFVPHQTDHGRPRKDNHVLYQCPYPQFSDSVQKFCSHFESNRFSRGRRPEKNTSVPAEMIDCQAVS